MTEINVMTDALKTEISKLVVEYNTAIQGAGYDKRMKAYKDGWANANAVIEKINNLMWPEFVKAFKALGYELLPRNRLGSAGLSGTIMLGEQEFTVVLYYDITNLDHFIHGIDMTAVGVSNHGYPIGFQVKDSETLYADMLKAKEEGDKMRASNYARRLGMVDLFNKLDKEGLVTEAPRPYVNGGFSQEDVHEIRTEWRAGFQGGFPDFRVAINHHHEKFNIRVDGSLNMITSDRTAEFVRELNALMVKYVPESKRGVRADIEAKVKADAEVWAKAREEQEAKAKATLVCPSCNGSDVHLADATTNSYVCSCGAQWVKS